MLSHDRFNSHWKPSSSKALICLPSTASANQPLHHYPRREKAKLIYSIHSIQRHVFSAKLGRLLNNTVRTWQYTNSIRSKMSLRVHTIVINVVNTQPWKEWHGMCVFCIDVSACFDRQNCIHACIYTYIYVCITPTFYVNYSITFSLESLPSFLL
jgi:hypothetical protein